MAVPTTRAVPDRRVELVIDLETNQATTRELPPDRLQALQEAQALAVEAQARETSARAALARLIAAAGGPERPLTTTDLQDMLTALGAG